MKKTKRERAKQNSDNSRLGRELWGLFAIFCGLLFILSLATFDSRDPWLNHVVSGVSQVRNKAGLFGAYVAGFLYDLLGYAAWMLPAFLCIAGARRILGVAEWPLWRWNGFLLLGLCICIAGAAGDAGDVGFLSRSTALAGGGNVATHGGGIIGNVLYSGVSGWLGTTGSLLLWIFCFLLAVQMLTGISWLMLILAGSSALWHSFLCKLENVAERIQARREGARTFRRIEPLSLPESSTASDVDFDFGDETLEEDADDFEPEPRTVYRSRKTPPAQQENYLVHPLLQSPDTRDAHITEQEDVFTPNPVPDSLDLFPGLPAEPVTIPGEGPVKLKGEEKDLPPWVRDFESASPWEPHTSETPSNSVAARQPDLSEDADLLDALWGKPEAEAPVETERGVAKNASARKAAAVIDENETFTEEPLESIPIHEAPPVPKAEMPSKPGVVESVLRRLNRKALAPLPSLELLHAAPSTGGGTPRQVLEAKGRSLMTCLTDFGIQGELVGITPGPVVTMFEVRPAPGVRVSRIANLSDDLALALKAVAVRIQAPVPGTDTVGIEIPNEIRDTVCLKELLASQAFQQSKSLLTLALGKDIAGVPAVADLATMPHLLVAGATGAGKSVGINSIILSLIYKARPEELKLLLVDPKRVEMAIYADLPHLVHPVVTEMQLAKNALEWAVAEMEERYNAIARAGVRNIADYNAKVASWGDTPPEGMGDLSFMPYLVIIIDELADLMLVAAKEVETSIVRLAQLARAAGIHLILATQRPSVDVVTGLIKANFPCRISFQVTSKHDSRTILDTVGAEHLLGKGDMLFKPGGGKFRRLHGAFVSDANVNAVVGYWKSRQKPAYKVDFADWGQDEGSAGGIFGGSGASTDDPLYNEAVDFVRQQGKASISLIQRKFRIGFNKAARYVEQMEQDGIIGPADGSKPRMVIG